MFLHNSWYVAAWAHELGDRPLARTILGEPIVLFRTASGAVGALRDRCPHRHLPLSMGKIVGEDIECGYHGMQFGVGGRCRAIPSQSLVPPSARVRAYPLREKYGWVWIWMGEADAADEALIPDFSKLTDPAFAAVGKTNHVRASYRLLIDNLLDLSHVGFVHTSTIGNAEFGQKGSLTSRRCASMRSGTRRSMRSFSIRCRRLLPKTSRYSKRSRRFSMPRATAGRSPCGRIREASRRAGCSTG